MIGQHSAKKLSKETTNLINSTNKRFSMNLCTLIGCSGKENYFLDCLKPRQKP